MRRANKQMSEREALALLIRGQEGVLATIGDFGYPYNVVVNYVYLNNKIYFHCAQVGHKIDSIKSNEKVSFLVYDQVEVIGEELNTKYQSVHVFGKAKVLDATHDVLLDLIKKYSNIDLIRANQMIEKEIDITSIVEIEIEHITGKVGK